MSRWTPVPVVGGAYTDDTKPWSVQDTVNRIPVMAEREGTRSPAMLRDLPGCAVFSILGSGAPVRGTTDVEGLLLAVSGTTLYSIAPTGVATSLGTIPGVGRVTFAHNQITNGSQVAIATGNAGYVYNTVTGVLAQITDAGFPGAKVFDFCDGYMMFVEPGGRYWGHSNLGDATDYNTLDRAEAEAQPDKIVTGIVSHREWIVFGQRSTEFYRNEGGATGTFQRINGTEAEVGAAGAHAVAKLDNTVFVVGHDGIGYRLNGYQFQRITTHPIEQAWSRCDLSQAYCYTFEDQGHKVWYVTMTDGQTWGYDVASGEWHRRKSFGLNFWRMSTLTRWHGRWIGGDYTNGQLYQLDWNIHTDAGQPKSRERTFAVSHDNQNRFTVNAVELVYNTGRDSTSPPLPQVLLDDLTISGDLPDGEQGDDEMGAYTASGGLLPYVSFTVSSGTFPAGLTLANDGTWSGTRTEAGEYEWTVTVTDSAGNTATIADTSETTQTISGEILLDAPILYWKLNEVAGTSVIDYSGNSRHGTYVGTENTHYERTANGIKMLGVANYPTQAGVKAAADLAMQVGRISHNWAILLVATRHGNPAGVSGVSYEPLGGLFGNTSPPRNGHLHYTLGYSISSDGAPRGRVKGAFHNSVHNTYPLETAAGVANDVPHLFHFVGSDDGGEQRITLYVDGVFDSTDLAGPEFTETDATAYFSVGGALDEGSVPAYWNVYATIAHAAVYDVELSPARVLAHAQAGGFA